MKSIWALEIRLTPTGPMTFRQMPSGLLHIMSYPFMPPTTMGGFLKRLLDIAEGGEWAGYGEDWFSKKGPGKEFTLTLGEDYRALGAFPDPKQFYINKARRQGPKYLNHKDFSAILRDYYANGRRKNYVDYQLHHWDYLFCESLTGWVAARDREPLDRLRRLKNFGGKTGKEGWAFVREIGEPRQLPLRESEFRPLGLVTPPLRPASGRFFNLYGHHWDRNYQWQNGEKGGVAGFTQLGGWWDVDRITGPYWAWDDGVGFPAHVPDDFLSGDAEKFL